MSDVLTADEIKYRGWLQIALKSTECNEKWNAVQSAVRQHDQLVEINKKLEEALYCLELAVSADREAFGSPAHKNAREVLDKAKELTNE